MIRIIRLHLYTPFFDAGKYQTCGDWPGKLTGSASSGSKIFPASDERQIYNWLIRIKVPHASVELPHTRLGNLWYLRKRFQHLFLRISPLIIDDENIAVTSSSDSLGKGNGHMFLGQPLESINCEE